MSRLGDTIQKARIKARMTEKALGKKCGLAESFINPEIMEWLLNIF